VSFSFRHLPVLSKEDATANAEQLQALLVKLGKIPAASETTKSNTETLNALLAALRQG
jgi:hypothetical protein